MATTTSTTTTTDNLERDARFGFTVPTIPASYWNKIDPEWASLWENHGNKQGQHDLCTIGDVRQDPSKYSFTYPTWCGM